MPAVDLGVQVVERLIILNSLDKFSPFRSPHQQKSPSNRQGQSCKMQGKVHPFANRSSQNAAPRLQTA
jgi:hypothetical protein